MAKPPALRAEAPAVEAKIDEEAKDRLADARRQKDAVEQDLREGYYFTRPRLQRSVRSDTTPETLSLSGDAHELVTGAGIEANEDFATEIMNGFFPRNARWAVSKKAATVPEDIWGSMKAAAKKADEQVFNEINDSNLYSTLGAALVPDVGLGTVALWIDERTSYDPVHCQHIPLRELDLNVGPYGDLDDRFATRHIRYGKLYSLVEPSIVPPDIKRKVRESPNKTCRVTFGFWRDWSKPKDYVWKSVVIIDGKVVKSDELSGEGCCPLVVMRFAPDPIHAFGNGPTLDALPDLRVVDMLTEAQQNRASTSMRPPFTFPDDGVMNLEGGIEDGKAYPKRPGATANDILPLYFQGEVDFGMITLSDVIRRVRRRHYADYPDQEGKTPPTATQWLDEMVMAQRRIGTPGLRFWEEGPAQIFRRFQFLGYRRGTVEKLQYGKRPVSTQPANPATQAQEQQEVLTAVRLLEMVNTFFPNLGQAVIDQLKTALAMKEKLGDELVVFRSEEEAAAMIQQLMQAAPEIQAAVGGEQPAAAPA